MTSKSIIFGAQSVRAILNGSKSVTRRALTIQPVVPDDSDDGVVQTMYSISPSVFHPPLWAVSWVKDRRGGGAYAGDWPSPLISCPFSVGMVLWVRESWGVVGSESASDGRVVYRASVEGADVVPDRWRSPIFMPRSASRVSVVVTRVDCQRLHEMTPRDATLEGVVDKPELGSNPLDVYRGIWDALNESRGFGWMLNPWVWVVTFKVVR